MNLIHYTPRTLDFFNWNRIFERFFDDEPWGFEKSPAVDIREDDNEYKVEVELPGLTEKDIEVKVENNVLTISSKKTEDTSEEEKKKDYMRRERRSYSFCRSFTLPDTIDSGKIEATFKDGLLVISLPKAPESKPKLIEVKVN